MAASAFAAQSIKMAYGTTCSRATIDRQPKLAAQRLSSKSSSYFTTGSLCSLKANASSLSIGRQSRLVVVAGNPGSGGPFAPIVVVVRNAMGVKEFNQFRGKAISLHSQVIKEFGKAFGVDNKQVQGLIRLAKKNGEKLGFLA